VQSFFLLLSIILKIKKAGSIFTAGIFIGHSIYLFTPFKYLKKSESVEKTNFVSPSASFSL
jgi:hypothetical protein